jgi:hypothetical protein
MVKRPLSTVTSLSSEGMEQALGTREKLTEDLNKKSEHTFGSELFAGLQTSPNDFLDRGAPASEKERIQVQKDINKSIAEGKAIMEAQVALSVTMFGIRRQELEGYEREAAIQKVMLQANQQQAALKAKGGMTAKAFREADEAISEDAELSIRQIKKKVNLKESSLKMEERIAALQHKGLAGDSLKIVRAGLEIKSLDDQIANETSPSAKRALQLQRLQKVNEAHGHLAPSPSNPFPFGTIASRGWESQFAYGGFAKRGIEDSLAFGGFADQSIKNGDSLTPEQALLNTGTSASDIAGYRKNVGALPGEQGSESPDVVAAIQDLSSRIEKYWGQ